MAEHVSQAHYRRQVGQARVIRIAKCKGVVVLYRIRQNVREIPFSDYARTDIIVAEGIDVLFHFREWKHFIIATFDHGTKFLFAFQDG